MDWQEKAKALHALADLSVVPRSAGNWYVSQGTEIGGDGFLRDYYGEGSTPQAAIVDHWRQLVDELPPASYIVVHRSGRRLHFRWSKFMWALLPNDQEES